MATKPQAGNPVDIGSGNKYQIETDYSAVTPSPLALTRAYNSSAVVRTGIFGTNTWRSSFDRTIKLYQKNSKMTAAALRADGKIIYFDYNSGQFTTTADIADRLTFVTDTAGQASGYSYLSAETGDTESYDNAGRLIKITARSGTVQNFEYDSQGNLAKVTDSFGKTLSFSYDAQKRVNMVTDPGGGIMKYQYYANNNLTSVTYQDDKVRQYLYEDANFPNALTGIIDENGTRFATWRYDAQGRAISSEHAGGAEKTTFIYGTDNTQVTDALNAVRTYNFEAVLGVVRSKGQSQPGGSGCGAASMSVTYDANGNVASRIDFNGNKTTYTYDLTRNLERGRTEAAGTAQARPITTEWHPTYRLPTRITEPKRITTNSYDSSGNLLSKTIQATTEVIGVQGLFLTTSPSSTLTSAPANTVIPRTWTYTYNTVGQVLTATGPRTDIVDKTTYDYNLQGNLIKITNAAGHVTTLSNYDANGKAGRIIDPNGMITDLTYSPRGWLTSKTVGGELTTYDYDGIGQLKKVTLSDSSFIAYTYDDAHRLTDITDSLGNSIHYTLDGMGNRIKEETKDPGGALTRQITRIYDALNRLQQVTGALQ